MMQRYFNFCGVVVVLFFVLAIATWGATSTTAAEKIRDNSFLTEEAYNQEAGIVQHINTFFWDTDTHDWEYAFTQEWPLFSIQHQLSYTLPVSRVTALGSSYGIGDLALHYRYQLLGGGEEVVALAPRFSVILPTGDEDDGLGDGNVQLQGNLPLSVELSSAFVTHINFGITVPLASDEDELFQFSHSLIWLMHSHCNFLLETLWISEGSSQSFLLNPGVRLALDLNQLQVVPGVAVPIGVGPSHGDVGVFFYLSLEHPFLR